MSSIEFITNTQDLKIKECSLKVTFKALTSVKVYFEFSSFLNGIYHLKMDDLQLATLSEGQSAWYEFIPERDYSIKFYRAKGYPVFKVFECAYESYTDCLERNKKTLMR